MTAHYYDRQDLLVLGSECPLCGSRLGVAIVEARSSSPMLTVKCRGNALLRHPQACDFRIEGRTNPGDADSLVAYVLPNA
jgi:hypothetical protein